MVTGVVRLWFDKFMLRAERGKNAAEKQTHFAWETRGIKDHHSPFLQTPTPCNSCMLHSLTPHHHRQIHRPRLRGIQCIRQPLNRIHRKGRAVVSLARERVGAHERPFDVGGDVGEDAGVVSTGEEGDDLGYGQGEGYVVLEGGQVAMVGSGRVMVRRVVSSVRECILIVDGDGCLLTEEW